MQSKYNDVICKYFHNNCSDFRQNVNKDVLNRLIESQYEVTDAFIQYLTYRKPDHQNGIHFIIPPGGFESNPASLTKLQKVLVFISIV